MSQIANSSLFLDRDFKAADSATLDWLIRSKCDKVQDTSKGRHWEAYVSKQEVGLTIHVYRTAQCLHDCEDELLELDLLPDVAPECISLVTNLGTDRDLKVCDELTRLISAELKCATRGAKLSS
jgi:hypothetical protein